MPWWHSLRSLCATKPKPPASAFSSIPTLGPTNASRLPDRVRAFAVLPRCRLPQPTRDTGAPRQGIRQVIPTQLPFAMRAARARNYQRRRAEARPVIAFALVLGDGENTDSPSSHPSAGLEQPMIALGTKHQMPASHSRVRGGVRATHARCPEISRAPVQVNRPLAASTSFGSGIVVAAFIPQRALGSAWPNFTLHRTHNGMPSWPRGAHCTRCTARPSRHAVARR